MSSKALELLALREELNAREAAYRKEIMSSKALELLALREELNAREAAGLYLLHHSLTTRLRRLAAELISG